MEIYIASKLTHTDEIKSWQDLSFMKEFKFVCSWLDLTGKVEDSERNAKAFWQRNFHDVLQCDALWLWADRDLHLRGGLVEVGMALGLRKPVVVIGDHPDFGTWQYFAGVFRAEDLRHAAWITKHIFGGN